MKDDRAVAIVGIGYSQLQRRSNRPLALLSKDACLKAIEDAGLQVDDIDGLATYPEMPLYGGGAGSEPDIDVLDVQSMITLLGGDDRIRWYAESHMGLITNSVINAYHALRSGACRYVLVWRAVHMPRSGPYSAGPTQAAIGLDQFMAPYGFNGLAWQMGPVYKRYMDRCGGTREQLATISINSRAYANLNPDAYFSVRSLTVEEYMSSRMLSEPVCIYDCDVPIDGCAAIVLTTGDRARDLPRPPAYIAALAQEGGRETVPWELERFEEATTRLSHTLWSQSGLTAQDMDAAMLYDGFSIFPLFWLEGLGFCRRGEALEFIQDGRIGPGGVLPMNTFGGALSQGRFHGLGHIIEAALQVSGRAESRQVPEAENVVVTTGSGHTNAGALVISRQVRGG